VSPEHDFLLDVPLEPVVISADATQLKQIFWNVARNAIQAMPGGGRLTVRLQQIPGRRIRIVFEDTGRGMSPDAVEQLFEPFSSSTSGGTGLGLSIVYQIVRDHNGTINVRSIEGEGSTITIELPTEHIRAMASNGDEAAPRGNRLAELLKVKGVDSNVSS
jgi:two-component system, NtrC family, sensor histidine kinase PilS